TLKKKIEHDADPVLKRAAAWSDAVNETVAMIVRNVPPFPYVRESLEKISPRADVMVVSATPCEALEREWQEHGIARYAGMICGQELGSKAEHIKYGSAGKYEPGKVLMIGDAPGDMKAAKENNALFYPVNPSSEAASWKQFYEEAAEKFFTGSYAGSYEQKLIDEFMSCLPEVPPWKR
ncbi:MAG: HAD family hydrolase, partial [Planctomycetota bacterium]